MKLTMLAAIRDLDLETHGKPASDKGLSTEILKLDG